MNYNIDKWLEQTHAESNAEALASLPKELSAYLSYQAYERGHAYGKSEVQSVLANMLSDFVPAWIEYQTRTGAKL